MRANRKLTEKDILPMREYLPRRIEERRRVLELKRRQ